MKIKRFNQINESVYDDFVKDVKKIVNYDEDEYEQGYEPSNIDLLDEIGDLCNKYNFTDDDIQKVVDLYPDDFEVSRYVTAMLSDPNIKFDDDLGQIAANIRNKLTPLSNLLALLKTYFNEKDEVKKEKIKNYIEKEMKQCKVSIDYLSTFLD